MWSVGGDRRGYRDGVLLIYVDPEILNQIPEIEVDITRDIG